MSSTFLEPESGTWVRSLSLVLPTLYAAHYGNRRCALEQRFLIEEPESPPEDLTDTIITCCRDLIKRWNVELGIIATPKE
jgi:hypothetical protein